MTTPFRTHSLSINLAPSSASTGGNRDGDDPSDATITIQCLSELTPLDMMDMSYGLADPTGSCVWLGAFLFAELFARESTAAATDVQACWSQLRRTLFPPECHAIELGAGTGMTGLSLMMPTLHGRTRLVEEEGANPKEQTTTPACPGPALMVLTDVNEDALDLCRINRDANIRNNQTERVHVEKLEWGEGNAAKVFGRRDEPRRSTSPPNKSLPSTYDVVFATDVLYDLQSLAPLVATASELLEDGGHFILSHVPRADIDADRYPSVAGNAWQQLEAIIISEAAKSRLSLASFPLVGGDVLREAMSAAHEPIDDSAAMLIRPSLLRHIWGAAPSLSRKFSWRQMTDVGAAVLVFQKRNAAI